MTCAATAGDDWFIAFDGYLALLESQMREMGIPVRTEVVGLFASAIPLGVERSRFDALPFRDRRGMVPISWRH